MSKLKKAKKPARVIPKPYRMSSGTPSQHGPPSSYANEKSAKTAGAKVFSEYIEWCNRHNRAGLEAIQSAQDELSTMPVLLREPRVVERCIDDHTGLTLSVRLWKEEP